MKKENFTSNLRFKNDTQIVEYALSRTVSPTMIAKYETELINKKDYMEYEQIKNRLAPCGIHCGKCFAFSDGDIKEYSKGLKESLGNFDIYAQRFVELLNEPVFKKYCDFKEVLTYLASVECKGCRKECCKLFKDCKVRDCHVQKKVDFCFQCSEFPCSNTGFDQHLHNRFVDINLRMRAIGVVKYYDEIRDKPRY